MKLLMTLLVRDEADIVEHQLAYHLNAGVDYVIATDHRSRDGTWEILERYARSGVLRLIAEKGKYTRQGAWQTRMARLAATEHGADWVINADADEFWWPRGASLKDVLQAVPRPYGVVRGLVRNFVPRRLDTGSFAERMTIRLATTAPINDPATPFRPVLKVGHRGHPRVTVGEGGSHQVFGVAGSQLCSWYPLEVLHFPLRSREQCARKYEKTWTGWEENLRGDLALAREAVEEGRPDAIWERVALDEHAIERGVADGALVNDVRLRDAFRAVGAGGGASEKPRGRSELDAHAFDAAIFEEAEIVRYQRWLDDLASSIPDLESARAPRRKARVR
jgi:hypothetical protein